MMYTQFNDDGCMYSGVWGWWYDADSALFYDDAYWCMLNAYLLMMMLKQHKSRLDDGQIFVMLLSWIGMIFEQ